MINKLNYFEHYYVVKGKHIIPFGEYCLSVFKWQKTNHNLEGCQDLYLHIKKKTVTFLKA